MADQSASPSRPPAFSIALGVALAGVAVLLLVLWVQRPGGHHHPAAARSSTRSGQPTAPPSATATPAPVRKATSTAPHQQVAAAAPSRFTFAGKAFSIHARVCGMDNVRPLDPPGEQHHTVCWVRHDFGSAPGSNSRGTTYVLGHAWGQDRLEVLNKLSETAMRQVLPLIRHGKSTPVDGVATYPVTRLNGYLLSLRTARGTLHYTVRDAYAVAKTQAGNIRSLMAAGTRNRVVLITCGELHHVDYEYNIIVEAYLTSSLASASTA